MKAAEVCLLCREYAKKILLDEIVRYNECDAVTTYLVWLRLAHFAGHLDLASYNNEQQLVADLLQSEIARGGRHHLEEYVETWNGLRSKIESERMLE